MNAEKKYLTELTKAVTQFLKELDAEMVKPSSPDRGKQIALLSNRLCLANDVAKRFGLGLDFNGSKLKREVNMNRRLKNKRRASDEVS